MTQSAFSGHCERFEESRGNLKTLRRDIFNNPPYTLKFTKEKRPYVKRVRALRMPYVNARKDLRGFYEAYRGMPHVKPPVSGGGVAG